MAQKADFHNRYDILARLGKGQFSTVYELLEKKGNKHWAGKVVNKASCPAAALESELSILSSLNHPNTIRLKEVFNTDEVCIIVQELVTGGELFDRISEHGVFTEQYASKFFRELLLVIKHLHDRKIVHRDLKPENIMLSDRTDNAVLKIIDFGASKFVINDKSVNGMRGTPPYMAPEIFAYASYGRPVDMWALGVILYVILAGLFPYDPDERRFECPFHSPEFDNVSESAKDILTKLLDINPDTRYTADQALKHPWVTGEKASTVTIMSVSNLRQMVAKRRFKRAIEMVRAANRFRALLKIKNSPKHEPAVVEAHVKNSAKPEPAIIDKIHTKEDKAEKETLEKAQAFLDSAETAVSGAVAELKSTTKYSEVVKNLSSILHSLQSQRSLLKQNTL